MLINGVERNIAPYADLRGADLGGADLSDANLRGANLRGANLRGADLGGADLSDADLIGANLRGANLSDADLGGADLSDADLGGANLRGADLIGANLRGADLIGADLIGANLRGANLRGADLGGADLRGANLVGAHLVGAKDVSALAVAQTRIVPDGELLVWKKLAGGHLCRLRIPADARRSNATGRKCRAEFAVVLEGEGVSRHDVGFVYRVGETVRPREPFDENRWDECASGIHFFLTREEAEDY